MDFEQIKKEFMEKEIEGIPCYSDWTIYSRETPNRLLVRTDNEKKGAKKIVEERVLYFNPNNEAYTKIYFGSNIKTTVGASILITCRDGHGKTIKHTSVSPDGKVQYWTKEDGYLEGPTFVKKLNEERVKSIIKSRLDRNAELFTEDIELE